MEIEDFRTKLNAWGQSKTPFVFAVDFEMRKPVAWTVTDVDNEQVWYNFNGVTNHPLSIDTRVSIQSAPESFDRYNRRFDHVMSGLFRGNSFLANLTIETPVRLSHSLDEIYYASVARYKLMIRNSFLVFSPETFVQVRDGVIRTFPMKGTIAADVPDAEKRILADQKEMAEHTTVVDLLRNDLSIVATRVKVHRFRYVEEVKTSGRSLLQVSSEINGQVMDAFRDNLGDLLLALLPAGSVSGAPKRDTLRLIRSAEDSARGYYTGVCGIFDGHHLDTGVMIRFIEQRGSSHYFRSGGGITTQSVAMQEYQEAIDKIYVPVH